MKRSDLQVGGQYVVYSGQTWSPGYNAGHRAVLLCLQPGWANTRDSMWRLEENRAVRYHGKYGGDAQRLAMAVEVVETTKSTINPDTGRPWTAEELLLTPGDLSRDLSRPSGRWHLNPAGELWADVVTARHWYPYAARPAEIKAPWQVQLDHLAAKRAEAEERYPAQLQAEADAQAEAERKRAEYDREQHERRIREAQNTEFYEQRLQPRLVELGIQHATRYGPGAGRVEITHEELARLLDLLEGRD